MSKTIICDQCQQPVRRLKHSLLCRCGMKLAVQK
ncbi:hypothetical protein HNR34_000192 [Geobacillus subterraneus]